MAAALPHAAAILSTLAHNGDNRNLALCGATCFELSASYSTPAYVSMDQPRSVTMVYLGRQASRRALVQVDAEDRSITPPTTMSLKLRRADNTFVTFANNTNEVFFSAGSGKNRLAVRINDPSFTTGAHYLTAVVTSPWADGTVVPPAERPVRVLVINQDASPYGWGWSIAGIHRIRLTGSLPTDSVVAWDGTGTVQYFTHNICDGSNTCTYDPPAGEFSTIKYNPNGAAFSQPFARFYPDGSIIGYDATGRERFSRDRFGNETRIEWVDAERIASITDPANKTTNFAYENGKLRTITDPGGRVTTVTIDGNGDVASIVDPGLRTIFRGTYQGHLLVASLDAWCADASRDDGRER
jgi:YD repeat-containing protein